MAFKNRTLQIGSKEGQPHQLSLIGAGWRGHTGLTQGSVGSIPAKAGGKLVRPAQPFDQSRVTTMATDQGPAIRSDRLNPPTSRLTSNRQIEDKDGRISRHRLQALSGAGAQSIRHQADPDLIGQQIDPLHRR